MQRSQSLLSLVRLPAEWTSVGYHWSSRQSFYKIKNKQLLFVDDDGGLNGLGTWFQHRYMRSFTVLYKVFASDDIKTPIAAGCLSSVGSREAYPISGIRYIIIIAHCCTVFFILYIIHVWWRWWYLIKWFPWTLRVCFKYFYEYAWLHDLIFLLRHLWMVDPGGISNNLEARRWLEWIFYFDLKADCLINYYYLRLALT